MARPKRVGAPGEHIPVLAREVCRALAPGLGDLVTGPRGVLVDATCGLGGHIRALLEHSRPARVIAFDRDPEVQAVARARLVAPPTAVEFVTARFSTLGDWLRDQQLEQVDAILADLGVSSLQLDRGERGFSWRVSAPLDLRMDQSSGRSAAELIAEMDAASLARILREYGEEPDALRIARAIVDSQPQTTDKLAQVVTDAMSAPQRRKLGMRIHPATRTFQALRIHVNAELAELDRLLAEGPGLLRQGGRMAIISFHSLEDRRVKRRFAELSRPPNPPPGVPLRAVELGRPGYCIPTGFARGITADPEETQSNPRARSARLRVLERRSP